MESSDDVRGKVNAEVIHRMSLMVADGASYSQIAEAMNHDEICTAEEGNWTSDRVENVFASYLPPTIKIATPEEVALGWIFFHRALHTPPKKTALILQKKKIACPNGEQWTADQVKKLSIAHPPSMIKSEFLRFNDDKRIQSIVKLYVARQLLALEVIRGEYTSPSCLDPIERTSPVALRLSLQVLRTEYPMLQSAFCINTDYNRISARSNAKKSGNCFVATAVFGSEEHQAVRELRQFRDQYLMRHRFGRLGIAVYYHVGPSLAHLVLIFPKTRKILVPILKRVAHMLAGCVVKRPHAG